jgi:hypothetical protein
VQAVSLKAVHVRLVFCLALGVLPLAGQVAGIAVYTDFQKPPSQTVVDSMRREVDAIVSPLGLDVVWRSINAPNRVEISRHLVVASFQGVCDARGVAAPVFRDGSLGLTHISDGTVLPYMDIDCNRIRGFIRTAMMQVEPAERDEMLGRAAGRVFAHELYHVLGKTSHHGAGTVDRSNYTVRELTDLNLRASACQILHIEPSGAPPEPAQVSTRRTGSRRRGAAKFAEKLCNVCHGAKGEGTRKAPALRGPSHQVDAAMLAMRLGIDGPSMCKRADGLKIVPPTLGKQDIDDLVRFLNAPPF